MTTLRPTPAIARWSIAFALCAAALLPAQKTEKEDEYLKKLPPDPYTKDDKELLKKAGYVSLGPFVFGDSHDTIQIDHVLAVEGGGIRWVETEHFKLGSALPSYAVRAGDKKEKLKIRAELKRLGKKLPRVKSSAKRLDRWLRLHLFAQRLEEAYAEFSEMAGCEAKDFPPALSKRDEKTGMMPNPLLTKGPNNGPYMGQGPHLGQPGKFTVLLFAKKSSLGNYARTFLDHEASGPVRHNFIKEGGLLIALAIEGAEGEYASDTALHCDVVYALGATFVDGFKYFAYQAPLWVSEGLAHHMSRAIDPRFVHIGADVIYQNDPRKAWDWEPRVRGRVRHDTFPKTGELMEIPIDHALTPPEHMMVWSRVEFLLTKPEEFRKFLGILKGLLPGARLPTTEEILTLQKRALQEAYGWDEVAYDKAWSRHVLTRYEKKRSKSR